MLFCIQFLSAKHENNLIIFYVPRRHITRVIIKNDFSEVFELLQIWRKLNVNEFRGKTILSLNKLRVLKQPKLINRFIILNFDGFYFVVTCTFF